MSSRVLDYLFANTAVQTLELATVAICLTKETLDDRLPSVCRLFVSFVKDAQRFQIAFEVEEVEGLLLVVDAGSAATAACAQGQHPPFVGQAFGRFRQGGVRLSNLEQPQVALLPVQVPTERPQHAWDRRGA